MHGRRTGFALVAAAALLAGCTGDDTAPPSTAASPSSTIGSTATTAPESTESVPGAERCQFDYSAQLAMYDTTRRSVRWTSDVPWGAQVTAWVDRSVAIASSFEAVTAVHVSDGAPAWEWRSANDGVRGLGHQVGTVSVVDGDTLLALDSATGTSRWSVQVDGLRISVGTVTPTATVSATTPVYTNEAGTITARDVTDGSVLWTYPTTGDWGGVPVLTDGELLEHAFEGAVTSLDPSTGAPNWVWTSRPGVAVGAAEVVSDDTVLVATTPWSENPDHVAIPDDAAQLVSLDRSTGLVRWSITAAPDIWYEPFRVVDGTLTVSTSDENAEPVWTGIDVATGATRWSVPGRSTADLRVAGGMLFASPYESGKDRLVRLDPATGVDLLPTGVEHSIRGLVPDGDHWLTGVSTASDAVAAIDSDGVGALAEMDPTTGAVSVVATFRDAVQQLVPTDAGLLVATADDMLFCD